MRSPILQRVIQKAFPGMPDDEAQELISIGEVHSYPPGVFLCREGEFERIFYIVLEGEVNVSKIINEAESRFLKPLGPGDFFGEYALIHDAPRTATIRTNRPTTVLEIHKETFEQLLDRSPAVSKAMVREVSRRLRENDEMALEDLQLKASELASAYQRLAEMDFARREFLTTIAHELRTPLTAASGFLHIIRTAGLQGESLQGAVDTVSRNIDRIITLSNDILFLQEMDLILKSPRSVDISSVVAGVVATHQERAAKNQVEISLDCTPGLPWVWGDPDSLERAIGAILENAVKFSPEGGDVWVRCSQQDGEVIIEVQDHGVGIPEESMPRIFDRFFHLERVGGHLFGGLGLGLSIAHQVVLQHQGEIQVESRLGEGSSFAIKLPAASEAGSG